MPGGVDIHTHFTIDVAIARSCDDFFVAPCAAACGGISPMDAGYAINCAYGCVPSIKVVSRLRLLASGITLALADEIPMMVASDHVLNSI